MQNSKYYCSSYNRSKKQKDNGWLDYCSFACKDVGVLDIPKWWFDPVKRTPKTRKEINFDKENRKTVESELREKGFLK